jgi:hypothetical protein
MNPRPELVSDKRKGVADILFTHRLWRIGPSHHPGKLPIPHYLKLAREFRTGKGEDLLREQLSPGNVGEGESDLFFCGWHVTHGQESLRGLPLASGLLQLAVRVGPGSLGQKFSAETIPCLSSGKWDSKSQRPVREVIAGYQPTAQVGWGHDHDLKPGGCERWLPFSDYEDIDIAPWRYGGPSGPRADKDDGLATRHGTQEAAQILAFRKGIKH